MSEKPGQAHPELWVHQNVEGAGPFSGPLLTTCPCAQQRQPCGSHSRQQPSQQQQQESGQGPAAHRA